MDLSQLADPAYRSQTRAPYLLAANITLFVLTWTTTVLRAHVRLRTLRAAGWDDYTMFICQAIFTMHLTCQLIGIYYGDGRHILTLPFENIVPALKCWFLEGLTYAICTSLVKISIGLLLLRFCISLRQIWLVRITIIIAAIMGVANTIYYLLHCRPISVWWSMFPAEHEAKCFAPEIWLPVAYVAAGKNVAVDVVFAAVPAWIMWHTTMNWRARLAVCLILGCGSLSIIGTIARIPLLATGPTSGFIDPFWDSFWMGLASTLELGLAIIAANGATLRPVFRRLLRSRNGTGASDDSSATPGVVGGIRKELPALSFVAMSESGAASRQLQLSDASERSKAAAVKARVKVSEIELELGDYPVDRVMSESSTRTLHRDTSRQDSAKEGKLQGQ